MALQSVHLHVFTLTHWGWVMHVCISKLTIIGIDNGLSPGQCQAIIWTNARILFVGPLGTNFSQILIKILAFSFKKIRLKVSSVKWHPFCLSPNVLNSLYQFCSSYFVGLQNLYHMWLNIQKNPIPALQNICSLFKLNPPRILCWSLVSVVHLLKMLPLICSIRYHRVNWS